jgi:hypothetical protein
VQLSSVQSNDDSSGVAQTGTSGTTVVLNDMNDAMDAHPANGVCETAPGEGVCDLRAAVQKSNASPGKETIEVPDGDYVLSPAGRCEDAAPTFATSDRYHPQVAG